MRLPKSTTLTFDLIERARHLTSLQKAGMDLPEVSLEVACFQLPYVLSKLYPDTKWEASVDNLRLHMEVSCTQPKDINDFILHLHEPFRERVNNEAMNQATYVGTISEDVSALMRTQFHLDHYLVRGLYAGTSSQKEGQFHWEIRDLSVALQAIHRAESEGWTFLIDPTREYYRRNPAVKDVHYFRKLYPDQVLQHGFGLKALAEDVPVLSRLYKIPTTRLRFREDNDWVWIEFDVMRAATQHSFTT